MPANKLTIIPVTLDPITDKTSFQNLQQSPLDPSCIIKTANAEISLFNGVNDHIVQAIMKELVQK